MTLTYDLSGNDLVVNSVTVGAAAGKPGAGILELGPTRFAVKGVNFNSATTDNAVAITIPAGITRYAVSSVWISNASHTLATATVSVFTAVSAGGATIAADQAITVTNNTADTIHNAQALTLTNALTECYTDSTLYVRVGTPESAAATADVTIQVVWLT